eukprot:gene2454-2790_t
MHLTKSVHVRIPVNFVFVGFGGEGNKGFALDEEALVAWFQHIEHEMPNVIVPMGEDYVTTGVNETPRTHIDYSFDIQVSKVDAAVTTLVEDAIFWHLRREAVGNEEQASDVHNKHYTNPYLVSSLLASLGERLDLNAQSYTVFVLNPNHPVEEGEVYGYRTGLANGELATLLDNEMLGAKLADVFGHDTDYDFAADAGVRPQVEAGEVRQVGPNLKFKDLSRESHAWAQEIMLKFAQYRNASVAGGSEPRDASCYFGTPDDTEDRLICAPAQLAMHDEARDPLNHAIGILNQGNNFERTYIGKAHKHRIQENCLVDAWISHKRFAFIDLTAGPFEWGPSVGGNGLKTNITLPKIPSSAKDLAQSNIIQFIKDNRLRRAKLESEQLMIQTIYENTCSSDTQIDDEQCNHLKQSMEKIQGLLNDEKDWDQIFNADNEESTMNQIDMLLGNLEYDPRSNFNFNYDHFKREMEKLKAPAQEFTFTIKSVSMAEDQALSLAFHSSLKTVLLPTITEDGGFETKMNYYIDSKEIKYQLTRLNPDNHVFIDKTLQAKTLANMVVAVQTNIFSHASTFSCNGSPTTMYLGNPVSAVLASTAMALGGLVPNQIAYSEASKSATQSWQWSVGDSPTARTYTFPFAYFSEFQRDAILRNYVVSALERSISITNSASKLLLGHKTNPSNYISLNMYSEYEDVSIQFAQIRDQWSLVADYMEKLDFSKAISLATLSEKTASVFMENVKQISSNVYLTDYMLIVLSLVLLHKKKSKLKIN